MRFLVLLLMLLPLQVFGAPKAELWPRWQASAPSSQIAVDHSTWDGFLAKYLVEGEFALVKYGEVTAQDKGNLKEYIATLEGVKVSGLNATEQKAYWINLYNALTINTVLDHYPVKSIKDIGISPGLFSSGPWGAKLAVVEGEKLTLDDIEHRILRPIFGDNRVHYALNCAAMGCPNLMSRAFTAKNSEELLNKGAHDFVNSAKGVRFEGKKLTVSRIYDWYAEDFGGDEEGVKKHLLQYADLDLAARISGFTGGLSYDYDWSLNGK